MKKFLKKTWDVIQEAYANILAFLLTLILFPFILVEGIAKAIKEQKLHLIAWTIEDRYDDLATIPAVILLFCLVVTIPAAIHMLNEREENRNERALKWEAKHPGKKA